MIRIHNSLTGCKEELRPISPGHVRMYVCGITVYDFLHIGHARMLIVFDMVRRYLQRRGLAVTLVQNITDIDDKIIRRAAENREPVEALTDRYIRAMHEDKAKMNVSAPDHEPRATRYVPAIVSMVASLDTFEPGRHTERFQEAMDDDFGTPEAMAVLQALARDINSARNAGETSRAASLGAELCSLASMLGIAQLEPEEWFRSSSRSDLADSNVESLIDARNGARRAKNWPEADRIRAELVSAGVIVEDKAGGGTVWRRA